MNRTTHPFAKQGCKSAGKNKNNPLLCKGAAAPLWSGGNASYLLYLCCKDRGLLPCFTSCYANPLGATKRGLRSKTPTWLTPSSRGGKAKQRAPACVRGPQIWGAALLNPPLLRKGEVKSGKQLQKFVKKEGMRGCPPNLGCKANSLLCSLLVCKAKKKGGPGRNPLTYLNTSCSPLLLGLFFLPLPKGLRSKASSIGQSSAPYRGAPALYNKKGRGPLLRLTPLPGELGCPGRGCKSMICEAKLGGAKSYAAPPCAGLHLPFPPMGVATQGEGIECRGPRPYKIRGVFSLQTWGPPNLLRMSWKDSTSPIPLFAPLPWLCKKNPLLCKGFFLQSQGEEQGKGSEATPKYLALFREPNIQESKSLPSFKKRVSQSIPLQSKDLLFLKELWALLTLVPVGVRSKPPGELGPLRGAKGAFCFTHPKPANCVAAPCRAQALPSSLSKATPCFVRWGVSVSKRGYKREASSPSYLASVLCFATKGDGRGLKDRVLCSLPLRVLRSGARPLPFRRCPLLTPPLVCKAKGLGVKAAVWGLCPIASVGGVKDFVALQNVGNWFWNRGSGPLPGLKGQPLGQGGFAPQPAAKQGPCFRQGPTDSVAKSRPLLCFALRREEHNKKSGLDFATDSGDFTTRLEALPFDQNQKSREKKITKTESTGLLSQPLPIVFGFPGFVFLAKQIPFALFPFFALQQRGMGCFASIGEKQGQPPIPVAEQGPCPIEDALLRKPLESKPRQGPLAFPLFATQGKARGGIVSPFPQGVATQEEAGSRLLGGLGRGAPLATQTLSPFALQTQKPLIFPYPPLCVARGQSEGDLLRKENKPRFRVAKPPPFGDFINAKPSRARAKQIIPRPLEIGQKSNKQDIVSITYEEIGFFPRSFSRVLDRFLKQVFSDVENLVIQEYRFYRYLFLTTLKCILILFFVPFIVNYFSKTYLVSPLTEYFWNTQQPEIFLNSYQQKRAFTELKDFEEKLYFESLINCSFKASPFDDIESNSTVTRQNSLTSLQPLSRAPTFGFEAPLTKQDPLVRGLPTEEAPDQGVAAKAAPCAPLGKKSSLSSRFVPRERQTNPLEDFVMRKARGPCLVGPPPCLQSKGASAYFALPYPYGNERTFRPPGSKQSKTKPAFKIRRGRQGMEGSFVPLPPLKGGPCLHFALQTYVFEAKVRQGPRSEIGTGRQTNPGEQGGDASFFAPGFVEKQGQPPITFASLTPPFGLQRKVRRARQGLQTTGGTKHGMGDPSYLQHCVLFPPMRNGVSRPLFRQPVLEQDPYLRQEPQRYPPDICKTKVSSSPWLCQPSMEISSMLVKNIEKLEVYRNNENAKPEFISPLVHEQKQTPTRQDAFEQRLQEKTIELAIRYNNQSIEAITNFFADLFSFGTFCYLLIMLEIQINITKSFLLEVFFGLDDGKKSLFILLITDLLVGYHSSNLWELFFEFLFNHYGLPESQTGIFLLVATLPVLLDVLFKYLIFRHLNRSSPATVATYHAIIE